MTKKNEEELEGMPEAHAHITYKVSGVVKEGFSLELPEIGFFDTFKISAEAVSVTEKKNKAGGREFTVNFTII